MIDVDVAAFVQRFIGNYKSDATICWIR